MTQEESNSPDALSTPDWTEIKVADETSTDDVTLTLQSLEQRAGGADRASVAPPSSAEGAAVIETCNPGFWVLSPQVQVPAGNCPSTHLMGGDLDPRDRRV